MSMPGFWEFAFLGVLALLIFGPDKLPGIARTVGRTVSQVRREARGAVDELKRAADIDELKRAANVDELREVGRELKETAGDIEREASTASAAASAAAGAATAAAARRPVEAQTAADTAPQAALVQGPPPFDPDAT